MRIFIKGVLWLLLVLLLLTTGFIFFVNKDFKTLEYPLVISPKDAPVLNSKQTIKVLSWNIHHLAGITYHTKNSISKKPFQKDIQQNTEDIAKIIIDENPDVILLQEVDEGAARTDYQDQLKQLRLLLPGEYRSYTTAFYWKSLYVPNVGKVGMKLCILSKYKIKKSIRYQLSPIAPFHASFFSQGYNWIYSKFYIKRAIQEIVLPVQGNKDLILLNTDLEEDYFKDYKGLDQQLDKVFSLLYERSLRKNPWVMGGSFHLAPPVKEGQTQKKNTKKHHHKYVIMRQLLEKYQVIPGLDELYGQKKEDWYTTFSGHSPENKVGKTTDYLFISKNISIKDYYIRKKDTKKISDHLPLILKISIP